jgi:hypothetical protein
MNNKTPWIDWFGGECPVPKGTIVDVVFRDGDTARRVPAGVALDKGFYAEVWNHAGNDADIVAYRVSQSWFTVIIDRNQSDTDPFWDRVQASTRAEAVQKVAELCADADGIDLMNGHTSEDRDEYIEGLRIVAVIRGKVEFVL